MPRAAQKSRRTAQCAYSEGGRRCRRSTIDESGLCGLCKIAVAEQVRAQQARGGAAPSGDGVTELLDRLLNRRRISRRVLEDAIGDVTAFYDQYRAQQAASRPPDYVPPNSADDRRARGGHAWWDSFTDHVRRAQQRPPTDPRTAEIKARRARARAVLGIEQTATITAEQLRDLRRKLSRIHHPDRGGTAAKMAEINDAIDVLEQSLVQPL